MGLLLVCLHDQRYPKPLVDIVNPFFSGSVAAGIQSGIGNVAAGSLFAALQSLGTVPLVTAGYSALVAGVCAVVAAVATIF